MTRTHNLSAGGAAFCARSPSRPLPPCGPASVVDQHPHVNCHPPQMPSLRAHYRVQVRTVVFSGAQHLEVASGSISRNLNQIPIIASSRQHIAPVLDPSRLPSTPSPPWVRSVGLAACVRCLGSGALGRRPPDPPVRCVRCGAVGRRRELDREPRQKDLLDIRFGVGVRVRVGIAVRVRVRARVGIVVRIRVRARARVRVGVRVWGSGPARPTCAGSHRR